VDAFDTDVTDHRDDQDGRENVQFDGGAQVETVGERRDETDRLPEPVVGKRSFRLTAE